MRGTFFLTGGIISLAAEKVCPVRTSLRRQRQTWKNGIGFFFQLWFFDLFGYSLISWMFFATSSFFFSVLSNLKCNGLEYTVSTFSTARPTKTGLRCLTLVWPQAHIDETQFFPPQVVGHYLEALCPGIKSASATFLGRYSAEGTNIENQASKYIIVSTIYIYQ